MQHHRPRRLIRCARCGETFGGLQFCARHRDPACTASAGKRSFSPRTWSGWIPVTKHRNEEIKQAAAGLFVQPMSFGRVSLLLSVGAWMAHSRELTSGRKTRRDGCDGGRSLSRGDPAAIRDASKGRPVLPFKRFIMKFRHFPGRRRLSFCLYRGRRRGHAPVRDRSARRARNVHDGNSRRLRRTRQSHSTFPNACQARADASVSFIAANAVRHPGPPERASLHARVFAGLRPSRGPRRRPSKFVQWRAPKASASSSPGECRS